MSVATGELGRILPFPARVNAQEEEMELRSVIRIDLDVLSSDLLMSTSERTQNI